METMVGTEGCTKEKPCNDCRKREMEKDSMPEKPKEDMTMKELYETGKYTCYTNPTGFYWVKNESPNFTNPSRFEKNHTHKLILKEHEHIADAVIANPNSRPLIAIDNIWHDVFNFFDNYDSKNEYALDEINSKPQCDGKFNGGYIKASQEAYDLLVEAGVATPSYNDSCRIELWIFVKDNTMAYVYSNSDNVYQTKDYKQFYINNGALSWDEPIHISNMKDLNELQTAGEEDGNMDADSNDNILDLDTADDISTCDIQQQTINTEDDNGKEYKFEKPEFECEFFKIGLVTLKQKAIIGVVKDYGCDILVYWNLDGKCHQGKGSYLNEYNLTPIKPKEITVTKIVSYEYNNQGAVESREEVTVTEDFYNSLYYDKE